MSFIVRMREKLTLSKIVWRHFRATNYVLENITGVAVANFGIFFAGLTMYNFWNEFAEE